MTKLGFSLGFISAAVFLAAGTVVVTNVRTNPLPTDLKTLALFAPKPTEGMLASSSGEKSAHPPRLTVFQFSQSPDLVFDLASQTLTAQNGWEVQFLDRNIQAFSYVDSRRKLSCSFSTGKPDRFTSDVKDGTTCYILWSEVMP